MTLTLTLIPKKRDADNSDNDFGFKLEADEGAGEERREEEEEGREKRRKGERGGGEEVQLASSERQ